MENFEATILISPDSTKNSLSKIDEDFNKLVIDNGGSIVAQEDWGLRDLAYKIKNLNKAFYNFYQVKIQGKKIQDLKKSMEQDEKIIRYLFIKVSSHVELPTILQKKDL